MTLLRANTSEIPSATQKGVAWGNCDVHLFSLEMNPLKGIMDWVLYFISQVHLLRSNRGLFTPAADLISDIKDVLLASQTAEKTVLSSLFYLLF